MSSLIFLWMLSGSQRPLTPAEQAFQSEIMWTVIVGGHAILIGWYLCRLGHRLGRRHREQDLKP